MEINGNRRIKTTGDFFCSRPVRVGVESSLIPKTWKIILINVHTAKE